MYIDCTTLPPVSATRRACRNRICSAAEKLLRESLELAREIGYRVAIGLALDGLGRVAYSQGRHADDAKRSFQAALKLAYEGGWLPAALYALTGLAALGIPQKNNQETLEMVFYVLQHPASTQETKDLALRLRGELESGLNQKEIEAVRLCAGSKSLDEIVHPFLESA